MKTTKKTAWTNKQLTDAGHDEENFNKVRALCEFLDCEPDDLTLEKWDSYGLPVFSLGSQEYAIGTDEEAQEAAIENIWQSVWAFNASFLSGFTHLPEEMFKACQDKCEGANDAFRQAIGHDNKVAFAEDAISADGRGHFLSGYDGNENEQGEFYIYRLN